MNGIRVLFLRLRAFVEVFRHFDNPWLIFWARLGLLRMPVFFYRITTEDRHYELLARPVAMSMADLFVLREVLVLEAYQDVLPLLPSRPVRMVDIGANLGCFTLWMDRRRGLQEAFCFEPEPDSFNLCRFNLAHNGCRSAQLLLKAVGGQRREIEMSMNTGRPGSVSIYRDAPSGGGHTCKVEVVSFAEWLQEVPGEFDLLKLDCEGAEWEILDQTPAECWRRFKVIVAEIHGDPQGRHEVEEFPKAMARHGFRTVRWDGVCQGLYVGQREERA